MSVYKREYKPRKRQSVVSFPENNSFRDSLRATHAAHPLLELQRRYGNRGVRRMVSAISRQGEGKGEVQPDIERAINARRGSGQPLDSGVRGRMESAFRADFSGVRVHTDAEADSLNRSLNARAFTTGRDLFFRSGAYNPGSSSGRELIAHELTHVVQQAGGISPKLTVGRPNDEYEQEADRVARTVVQQEHLQRQPMEEEEEEMQMKGEGQGIQRREEGHNQAPDIQRLTVRYPSGAHGFRQSGPVKIGNYSNTPSSDQVSGDVGGNELVLQRLAVTYPSSPTGSRQHGPSRINSTYSVRWTAFIRNDTLCFEFEKVARDAATITVNLYDDQMNGWLGSGAVSWTTGGTGYKYIEFTGFPRRPLGDVMDSCQFETILRNDDHPGRGISAWESVY